VKALRHLKATRPSVFQIRSTGAQIDHPGKNDVGDTVHADSEHEQDDSDLSQLRGQLGVGHVLPDGFQRIRYYGFLGTDTENRSWHTAEGGFADSSCGPFHYSY